MKEERASEVLGGTWSMVEEHQSPPWKEKKAYEAQSGWAKSYHCQRMVG